MGSMQRHETDEDSSMEWKTWQVNNLSFIGGCHHNLSVSAAKHCCWKVHVCSYKYTALCSNNFTVRSCQNQKQFCSSKNQLCSDKHTFAATNMLHFTATIVLLAAVKTGSSFAAAKINFAVTSIPLVFAAAKLIATFFFFFCVQNWVHREHCWFDGRVFWVLFWFWKWLLCSKLLINNLHGISGVV